MCKVDLSEQAFVRVSLAIRRLLSLSSCVKGARVLCVSLALKCSGLETYVTRLLTKS